MAGSIIGKVSVKVWPDTRGFKKEAEAGLKGQEPSDIDVGVDADVKKALAKIEALEKKIKDSVTVDVDASTAGAAAKVKAFKESIERDEARLKVEADVDKALSNAQRDFEKFKELSVRVSPAMSKDALRAIRRDMDVLLHKRERLQVKIGVETDKFKIVELKRSLDDVERSIKRLKDTTERDGDFMHRFNSRIGRGEHALRRFGDAAGRAFGRGSRNNFLNFFGGRMGATITSLVAPLLLVAGTFKAVTAGMDTFKQVAEETGSTAKGIFAGISTTLSGVTSSLFSAVAAVATFGAGMLLLGGAVPFVTMLAGALTALVATITIGLIGSVAPLIPLFAALAVGAGVAAAAFVPLIDDIKKGRGEFAGAKKEIDGLKKAVDALGKQAAPALGRVAQTLAKGATVVVKTMTTTISGLFDDLYEKMSDPRMQYFYDQWAKTMPSIVSKFGQGLNSLALGLVAFFTPVLRIADELAGKFRNAMERFREWSMSAEGQNSIADFFEKAWDRAKTLWSMLKHLAKAIANIFTQGDDKAGKGFLESWEKSLEKFEKWTSNPKNMEKFWDDVKEFGSNLKNITEDVADFFKELNKPENRDTLNKFLGLLRALFAGMEALAKGISAIWNSSALNFVIEMFGAFGVSLQVLPAILESVAGAIGSLTASFTELWNGISFEGFMATMGELGGQIASWAMEIQGQLFAAITGWIATVAVAMGMLAQNFLMPLITLPMQVVGILAGIGVNIFTTITGWAIQAGAAMLMVVQSILTPLLTLPFQIAGTLIGVGVNIFTTIAGWAGQAAMAMFTVVQAIITPMMNLPLQIAGFLMQLPGIIIGAIMSMIPGASASSGSLANGISLPFMNLPTRIGGFLATLAGVIVGALTAAIGPAIGAAMSIVTSVVTTLASLPGRARGAITGIIGAVTGILSSARGAATSLAGSIVSGVVGILSRLPSGAASAISGITGALSGIMSSTMGAMVGLAGSLVSAVVGALSPLPQQAAGVVLPIVMQLTSIGQRTMAGLAGAIAGGIGAVVSAAGQIPSAIIGAVGDLSNLLVQTGKDVVNGLVSGIESRIGSARTAAGKLGGIVKSVASMRLEVRSPSRVFMRIGEFVVEGLAKGMSKTRAAEKAASNLGQSALDATNKTLEIHSPSRAFMRSGTNTVKGLTKGVKKQSKVDRRPMIAAARRMMKSFSTGLYSQAGNIRNYLGSLIKEIPKMTNVMARKWSMNLAKQLKTNLTQWERLRDSYNEWRNKMTELTDARNKFAEGMVSNALDIAGLGNIEGGFDEVIHRLTTAKAMTNEFAKHLATLRKNGLREDLYEDIASMGAEQGLAAAKAIAEAGKKGVQQVNALQTDLLKSSSKVANKSANHLYGAGLEMATSIAEGFASEMNAVERRMVKMARDLAVNINRELRTNGVRPVVEMPSMANRGAGSPGSYSESLNSGSTRILNYYAAPGSAQSTEQELFKAFKKAGF